MRIDIMTLFPDTVNSVLHESIIGRACKKGIIEINSIQIRDYTENKQMQVDDYPYGGGHGCVMMAQPLKSCLDSIMSTAKNLRSRVIYMSPQGKPYNQETAKRLVQEYDHLVLVCGHYEGIDERFIELCVDEEISIGDYVLTGGEIAAMAVADSVCRMVPGVLSDEECYTGESHWSGVLEYPQYTRPEIWEGRPVPEVLIQGNHAKVDEWRRMMSLKRTMEKRPDMFDRLDISDKNDKILIEKIKKDEKRMKLVFPVEYRKAVMDDLSDIMEITDQARTVLKQHKVDQWQGAYPTKENYISDILKEQCYTVIYQGEIAGFFTLSTEPEKAYEELSDGRWHYPYEYCVLHRAAVKGKFRGSNMSDRMLECVTQEAKRLGMRAIRTDTHRKNEPMKKLLDRNGYRFRGNLAIECEPGQDPRRQAFEKGL